MGYSRYLAKEMPHADAIVILSAGRTSAPGIHKISEWTDPDRFFGGLELFRAKKASLIIFTGGWSPLDPAAKLEGVVLQEFAVDMGVPRKSILVTGAAKDTAEEAHLVNKLLKTRVINLKHIYEIPNQRQPKILLVTSAFHMKRAKYLFEQKDFEVVEYPVDFKSSSNGTLTVLSFIPSAGALSQSEFALRELYGRAYYSIKSYIIKK